MEFALGTLTSGLSTFAFQFIDRSFDHWFLGKKGINKLTELISKIAKGLPKLTEVFSFCFALYAHYYKSIQI